MTATPRFPLEEQGEVFFSTPDSSRQVRALLDARRVRHVGGRLYTKNLDEPLGNVVRRRVWDVARGLFPGAVIVDRTAFEPLPVGVDGSVFLCSTSARVVKLPGLVLNCRRGPGPVGGDTPFLSDALYLSSAPRRFLDNIKSSRAHAGVRRTLSRSEIEAQLERLLANQGDSELERLRDEVTKLAPELGREGELGELLTLIAAMLGTPEPPAGSATSTAGAPVKEPWDEARLPLFDVLFAALHSHVPVNRPATQTTPTFSFFDAYFSNSIEGAPCTVEQAAQAVFDDSQPSDSEAHAVRDTFALLSAPTLRARTPHSAADLLSILATFHGRVVAGGADAQPGRIRLSAARAGSTEFVAPTRIRGTLRRGYEYYRSLQPGLAQATFAMFLICEVHPFDDGNGRVARALANAEISAAGRQRLTIPIALREDYLQALRAMSIRSVPGPLIAVLDRAQAWTAEVDWSSMAAAQADLERTHALLEPAEAQERGVKLRLPSELAD